MAVVWLGFHPQNLACTQSSLGWLHCCREGSWLPRLLGWGGKSIWINALAHFFGQLLWCYKLHLRHGKTTHISSHYHDYYYYYLLYIIYVCAYLCISMMCDIIQKTLYRHYNLNMNPISRNKRQIEKQTRHRNEHKKQQHLSNTTPAKSTISRKSKVITNEIKIMRTMKIKL